MGFGFTVSVMALEGIGLFKLQVFPFFSDIGI
jgi:hypothetical protein